MKKLFQAFFAVFLLLCLCTSALAAGTPVIDGANLFNASEEAQLTALVEAFREETGISVQQAIVDARLKRACELIDYGGLRLSDIALMVGFQDQSYFSRTFQKAYGITPTQYRRSHQK